MSRRAARFELFDARDGMPRRVCRTELGARVRIALTRSAAGRHVAQLDYARAGAGWLGDAS